jgi:hypothetical protein
MDILCGSKRPFQADNFTKESVLNQESNQTKKRPRNIYDKRDNRIDSFASVTWSRLKTVTGLGNGLGTDHKQLNARLSRWLLQNVLSAFPPDALYSIFPIQLELTKENLELHEAFLTQSCSLSDHFKLAVMHVQRYIDQQVEAIQHPYSTHINSSSQACGIFPFCGVNSCTMSGGVIKRGIDQIQNEFSVKQYLYDAAHDPLLPYCPPITDDNTPTAPATLCKVGRSDYF